MNSFTRLHQPSPTNCPHTPSAQFCAVGGARLITIGAEQFQSIEFAEAQPTPWFHVSRLFSSSAPPSMSTMSNSVPDAQLPVDPLKPCERSAVHSTNAFGPAAR